MTPSAKREAVGLLITVHGLSVTRACRAVRLSREAYYRPTGPRALGTDAPVIDAHQSVVTARPRCGFWKCFDRRRMLGHPWNHKRLHRIYCALRLNFPRQTRWRIPRRVQHPLAAPAQLKHTWALDFMTDVLCDGRDFRTLNELDEGIREGLAIEVGMSLPSLRVIAGLDDLVALHGAPRALRVDNALELTSITLTRWCAQHQIAVHNIQPGKPQQNTYIERFNRTHRTEVLDAHTFHALDGVREVSTEWNRELQH